MTLLELATDLMDAAQRDPHREVVVKVDKAYVYPCCGTCSSWENRRHVITSMRWEGRDIVLEHKE